MTDPEETLCIIDTDVGVDDARAIFLALKAHHHPQVPFKLLAITCVAGNTHLDQVVENLSHVLHAAKEESIPVYKGAEQPLLSPYIPKSTPFHGYNGFGEIKLPSREKSYLQEENGILALIRLAKENKGKISIMAIGPLTNLALALRLDPSIKSYFKEIYIMGGNIEGIGNTSLCGEFNFLVDPESAYITLNNYQCEIFLIPWEICMRQSPPMEWRMNVLGKLKSEESELINKVEAMSLKCLEDAGSNHWIVCDELTSAALIFPKVIKELKSSYCLVELQGKHTRGQMILDHKKMLRKKDNVKIITEFDMELFQKMLIWGHGGPFFK